MSLYLTSLSAGRLAEGLEPVITVGEGWAQPATENARKRAPKLAHTLRLAFCALCLSLFFAFASTSLHAPGSNDTRYVSTGLAMFFTSYPPCNHTSIPMV